MAGATSCRGRTGEALWVEGGATVGWELGGIGSGIEEEASERRGVEDVLCLDLGEG